MTSKRRKFGVYGNQASSWKPLLLEGAVSKVVTSTIGAAQDMESEDLRRLYVNCIYWALGLESAIPLEIGAQKGPGSPPTRCTSPASILRT